ncbi:hypothetical protein [Streptomyces sp. AK08-02]|uniref:hypothetical protein n=1 Tax=Streptomyces sp. AK08-02 TaxID=3028654 RepID=UPI0029A092C1|nr:hypothetical protein [Streptomyces sp. AK08-02]MDX3745320.1 hypothetical protein [Streptomyces sp. AK08-02]
MSGQGRRAVLPPAGHRSEPPLAPDGLTVTVTNKAGYKTTFDFAELPVAEAMQRSLAAAFAAQSREWTSHLTAQNNWARIRLFVKFLSEMDRPPDDLDGLTVAMLRRWRVQHVSTNAGKGTLRTIRTLLQRDPRLATGPVAEELAHRIPPPAPSKRFYEEAERDRVVLAAQRQFRSAWLRIGENTRQLDQWRDGGLPEGSREWRIGKILDHVARTGDVPRTRPPNGQPWVTNYGLLGGNGAEKTWGRLFLTRKELTALAVVLTARFGWNLSVYDRLPVPTTAPSAGETASVTYQVQIEKRRAGSGRWFSTENITDSGADSSGRLITQALEATTHARALADQLAPGTDLLMVARVYRIAQVIHWRLDGPPPVGPLAFGVTNDMGKLWAQSHGLGGSPFQLTRRSTVTGEGRPLQHTQGTHESIYVLPDRSVQRASRDVFEAGAQEALEQARAAVFAGTITQTPGPGHQRTATVDCEDDTTSPWPAPDGGCGADFLLCLACANAHVHPGHHSRLAHLHQQILSLKSVLDDRTFRDRWSVHLQRLEDLRGKVGPAAWTAALARVTDTDRTVVQLLVKRALVP